MSDELPTTQFDSAGLIGRAKAILMTPKEEWPKVAAETTEPMKVLTTYVLPLAVIGPVAGFIGSQLFGYGGFGISFKPSIGTALTIAVMSFVMAIVGVYVLAFVANLISPKFGGRESFPSAFRLVAYAMTAAWVGAIFGLIPSLALIGSLIGLYSLYLIYAGATPVMGVPEDKAVGFTVVTILAAIVLYIVVGAVTGMVTGSMMASTISASNVSTVNLGELGSVTVDGDNSSVDLGDLGRVEMDGNTATLTVDGQQVQVNVEEAAAAAKKAAAAQAAE